MFTSSKINSVTFKNLDGGYPNKWNTLHADRKQAGYTIIEYCQQFNYGDIIYLQFTSDVATLPTLNIFIPEIQTPITGTLVSSYTGLDNRYFFDFEVTLGATYYDKKITFTCVQGANTLTSEPIYCRDLTEDIADGKIRRLKYTNLDRNESDLSDYWIDWSEVAFMYFYVEAVDLDPNDSDSIEILEGSQSKTIISANYYSGLTFNTGGIPDYLATKIGIISDLDVFEMNGLQYIKEGEIEQERYGQSTSIQCSLKLTQKNEVGLNVDDLGITNTDTTMAIVPIRNTGVTTAGAVIENPEGYMLHSIFIRHALTSAAATAVVTIGTTLAGTDLIDAMQGSITLASYPSTGKFKGYSRHFLKNPDAASNVYIAVSGTGAVMDIIINFDTVIDTTS